MGTLAKVIVGSVVVIVPLVAAAFFTPPDFPLIWRQVLLGIWGVGGTLVVDRLLFGAGWSRAARAIGLRSTNLRAIAVAALCGLPMWLFPYAWGMATGTPVGLNTNWVAILIGVVLVNGLAEEVIHRGFVFGHMRRASSFVVAASISAAVFAAQHLYLLATMGAVPGLAAVVLAALLAFPLAFMFERGGNSIVAPAILHTSSNASLLVLSMSPEAQGAMVIPHMSAVLVSIYLCFAFSRWLPRPADRG